jgi:hypothetical protein
MMYERTCEHQGINQVRGACVFAAIATLLYRLPRLYEIMHNDIKQWVNKISTNFIMSQPIDEQCPDLPEKFWHFYFSWTGKDTIYNGNDMEAINVFLHYSFHNFQSIHANTVLDAETLQAWLKYPYRNNTSLKASNEGEKPDLCLITGFVHLNNKAELIDIQRVLEELHVACLNYPAYGAIIGTNFEEKRKDDNHAYVMTVCDDINYYICSHGKCWLGIRGNPEPPDLLGLGERVSQLRGLEFVLFCEKRKQLGIDLHVFKNVLYNFEMFMGEGYQLYLPEAGFRYYGTTATIDDAAACQFASFHKGQLRENKEGGVSEGVLDQPIRVEYKICEICEIEKVRRTMQGWQCTVNAIRMCVCRTAVEGTTLAVYFEELVLEEPFPEPYMASNRLHSPVLKTVTPELFTWPAKGCWVVGS